MGAVPKKYSCSFIILATSIQIAPKEIGNLNQWFSLIFNDLDYHLQDSPGGFFIGLDDWMCLHRFRTLSSAPIEQVTRQGCCGARHGIFGSMAVSFWLCRQKKESSSWNPWLAEVTQSTNFVLVTSICLDSSVTWGAMQIWNNLMNKFLPFSPCMHQFHLHEWSWMQMSSPVILPCKARNVVLRLDFEHYLLMDISQFPLIARSVRWLELHFRRWPMPLARRRCEHGKIKTARHNKGNRNHI